MRVCVIILDLYLIGQLFIVFIHIETVSRLVGGTYIYSVRSRQCSLNFILCKSGYIYIFFFVVVVVVNQGKSTFLPLVIAGWAVRSTYSAFLYLL